MHNAHVELCGMVWTNLVWKKNNIEQHEESKNTVMLHEGEYSKTSTRTRERSGARERS